MDVKRRNGHRPRVLLTASYGPNDLGWGEDMYDLMTSRLGRGHGPFQITSHCHYFALYLIAENISCPTTVLENPHWDEFARELDEGYEVVGFQLKSLHTAKIARMMKRVREKLPRTKIVVGGYGVSTLATPVPGDRNGDAVYIRENADYLCREEGVGFMRRILDDTPLDREITQYPLPMTGFSMAGLDVQARVPTILVSLGCPNACDFCNTSAFFHNKKLYVAEPAQVYRFMKNYQARLRSDNLVVILFDEDFFLNREYVRELGRLLRSDRRTWGISYFTFGGVRSLSQFEPEELRDNGLSFVWIGVESFLTGADLTDDHYGKRKGAEVKELFDKLHRNGIGTVASLVLGFDFHDRENLKQDIDRFVALKPEAYQISPLTPCPGTPLYDRMLEEGRILDSYRWEDFNLWKDDVFALKNLKPGEVQTFFGYAHQQLTDVNGPQALMLLEVALDYLIKSKGKRDAFHVYKADLARKRASALAAYLPAVIRYHRSETVRERARMLERRIREEVGSPPWYARIAAPYLSRRIAKNIETPPAPVVSDPPPRWSYYRTFDDRIWVKKGRRASGPVPYRDRFSPSREIARIFRGQT